MYCLFRSVFVTLCLFAATVAGAHAQGGAGNALSAGESPFATSSDQNGTPVISNRIVASHRQVTAGQVIQVAWEFKLSPHWHIYWSNAGDSGLPPELKSTMPSDNAPLVLTWPTPKVISIPPVTNYGYEDAVTFTATYTVPSGLANGMNVLPFKASYLYCNEICMPGKAELRLPLVIGAKPIMNPAFKGSANLPATLPARGSLVAEAAGRIVQLALPLNLSTPNTRFIPAEDGVIDDSAPQTITGNILSIPLDPQAETAPTSLSGLLIVNGQGYSFTTPLNRASGGGDTPPGAATGQPAIPSSPVAGSFTGAVFFAFLAGLILNLMPCVLPVLSLKLLSLVRHHHGPSRVRHTLAYTGGVIVSFWVFAIIINMLKSSGTEFGWGFHLQNSIFVAVLVLTLLTVALNFFGIFEVGQTLTRLGATPVAGKSKDARHPSLFASFATGTLAVVVATPCTVPFMGGAMAYALTQSLAASLAIFTALGFGMAMPFLIAIPFPQVFRWLPKPGKWTSTFRHALGWPMLATALWLAYVFASQTSQATTFLLLALCLLLSLVLWCYGTRPGRPAALAALIVAGLGLWGISGLHNAPQNVIWQPFTPAAVEEARKSGNPVFIDFTADWCLTCKVTEATVLNTTKTQQLFAETRTTIFKADWTSQNEQISAELARHNRKGVPLYLLYMPGADAEILPQLLTYSVLQEKLKPTSR